MSNKNKKPNNNQPDRIFLNLHETKAIALGLGFIMEEMQSLNKGEKGLYPWNPQTRKDFKDIAIAARSAANKLEKVYGIKSDLPEYNEGDEQEFFTRES